MASAAVFPVMETERLVLRAITDDDAAQLFAIHSDPRWMAWWGADPPADVAQSRSLIETWTEWRRATNPGVRWGLQRKADGQLIGSCGLFKWNQQRDSCSTSYELASWSAGNGYMTEAMTAVLEWGWDHMSLHRIEALVHPSNTSSRDLLGRLGFEREGHLRQAARWSGRYHDLLLMGASSRTGPAVLIGGYHSTSGRPRRTPGRWIRSQASTKRAVASERRRL